MSFCPSVPALTPDQIAALQAQLSQALIAYHNLQIGQAVTQFRDQNGETITYTAAKIGNLEAYIGSLQAQLGLPTNRSRPPLRPFMGPL